MNKIVPFKSNYENVRKFENVAYYLLVFSALIVGVLWLLPQLKFLDPNLSFFTTFKTFAKPFSYASMIGYLLLSMIGKFLFKAAEKTKRDDLIDNSFGTKYSDENSQGYYSNEDIPIGVKKLAVNTYESCFHTENTLKKMLFKSSIKVLLLSIPFLLSIFTEGGDNIMRLLFEISIPIIMISQFATTIGYYNSVKELNERFKIELINIGKDNLEFKDYSKLLIPTFEYYNTKSWASVNLDKNIFEKHNDVISSKWLERKENLGLK